MSMFRSTGPLLLLALFTGMPTRLVAQTTGSRFTDQVRTNRTVQDAVKWIDDNYDAQVEEWIRITEIPGKSQHEQERGAYVRAQMEAEGLEVTTDSIGNVTGIRRGTGGGPTIVFAAHMDTVHPLDTDVTVRRDGDILRAPGIFDNSASVANMLATIRAMNRAGVRTQGDLIFVATVQEELGLVGMGYWFDQNPGVADMLVAMDGGLGGVSYGALGIYWTRYWFRGEGSHTNSSTGKPHPVRALAEAVDHIYELQIPEGRGGAVYNIGMIGGGKIFNGIPQDVFFTMDLRSVNPVLLDSLDAEIESRVKAAAEHHKVRWDMEREQHLTAGGTGGPVGGPPGAPGGGDGPGRLQQPGHSHPRHPVGLHRREPGRGPGHPLHRRGPGPGGRPAHPHGVRRRNQRSRRHPGHHLSGGVPGPGSSRRR